MIYKMTEQCEAGQNKWRRVSQGETERALSWKIGWNNGKGTIGDPWTQRRSRDRCTESPPMVRWEENMTGNSGVEHSH